MHNFDTDLYGKTLKLCICGFLRSQEKYNSLDELIIAINNDIKNAEKYLDEAPFNKLRDDDFFSSIDKN